MFRSRLTWFWVALSTLALGIVARLVQLQVVDRAYYMQLADRVLTRPAEYTRALRGSILDRSGVVLVRDEPTFDVSAYYGALAYHAPYLRQAARILRQRGEVAAELTLGEVVAELPARIDQSWAQLAEMTDRPLSEILQNVAEARERVDRIRDYVRRRSPSVRRIREEAELLPVLAHIDSHTAVAIRLQMERLPWLRVVPSSRRVARDADSLVHVIGRLGAANAERIASDPLGEDELRGLRPGDACGITGVERLADTTLRGTRGRRVEGYTGELLERRDPIDGTDVLLTIDLELQRYVIDRLAAAVNVEPQRTGAAAVVIDVASREILALASYPTYSYDAFNADYGQLVRDARRTPLLFRAVQAEYPPGSICKAITLVAGLSTGTITPDTRFHCTGHLLPDKPDRFRCWIYNEHWPLTHDMTDDPAGQDAESAVRNSCNLYFFRAGERLGADRLCQWFERFGLGRDCGTGLIEENDGIVPDEAWMRRVAGRSLQPADAWNFSIGQGEVTITPLQAANVVATIAAGLWQPVRLVYDRTGRAFGPPPQPPVTFDETAMQVLRRGMWRVVNERGGTATAAQLDRSDFVLCGKTGSAQAQPRPTVYRYTFEWPDGRREERLAYLEEDARADLPIIKPRAEGSDSPRLVGKHTVERFPALEEGDRLPAHAWFVGWTQSAATPRGVRPAGRVYAIAVVIEYGGSGGRVAAPVAKEIAEHLLRDEPVARPTQP